MARSRAVVVAVVAAASLGGWWLGRGGRGTDHVVNVVHVVDGDTVVVDDGHGSETVRLLGVDTPETVHPQKPVEYFGKEASAFTKRMAEGQLVRLERDLSNADRDPYGRLLRYVYLEDGRLLNAEIIAQGYGFAYVKFPFERMEEFRELERQPAARAVRPKRA